MFHIKPDKRSQMSASLIVNALHQCLQIKPFEKITIADIQRESTVGRATFYRLFDKLSDVLLYECDQVLLDFLDSPETDNPSRTFNKFFTHWMRHAQLLEAVVLSNNGELLYAAYRAHASEIGERLSPKANLTNDQTDFLISIATSAQIGVLSTWIQHHR